MTPERLTRLVACLLVISAASVFAGIPQYLPIDPDLEWNYVTAEGGTCHMHIEGPIEVFGVPCTSVFYDDVAHHTQTYRNFWTVDESGNMYIHGAQNFRYPFLALFDPPVRWLEAPLEPGQTWTFETWIYHYWDHSGSANFYRNTRSVKGLEEVTTPAGTFPCHVVGFLIDPPQGDMPGAGEYDLLGRYLGDSKSRGEFAELEWWADGVGYIRRPGNIMEQEYFELVSWSGTTPVPEIAPAPYELRQCVPNPFNPVTSISFTLPQQQEVQLDIFGIDGKRVTTLVDRNLSAGDHRVAWNGQDQVGRSVPSGVYFYRLVAGQFTQTRRMVLIE